MKINKQKIKRIAQFLIFIFIIWEIFIACTYLFRNTKANANITRENVVGFYDEKPNSLDIVFIAGSNAYRYWDCMRAYNEYGFTSYNFAVSSRAAATTISAIEEVMKTQQPQLIVIDVRKMLSDYVDTTFNANVRNALDSQDYNLNRLKAVEYFRKLNDISVKETLSSYIDLIHYHDNYSALSNPLNWEYWDNRSEETMNKDGLYKGFAIAEKHEFLEMPMKNITQESKELPEVSQRICADILEYCKNRNVPVLLVAAPFQVTKEEKAEINSIKCIADKYNVDFIDFNEHYEEMDLDFSTDFYNKDHVNILGVEKYTDYLAAFLVDNYNLPDHRKDSEYSDWLEVYEDYIIEKEDVKSKTLKIIEAKNELLEMEEKMKKAEQAHDWLLMADNNDITVFIIVEQACINELSYEDEVLLNKYGLSISEIIDGTTFIGTYSGERLSCIYNEEEYEGKVSGLDKSFRLSLTEDDRELLIGTKRYSIAEADGIQMLAYDENVRQIVDAVVLNVSDSGNLLLEHMPYEYELKE